MPSTASRQSFVPGHAKPCEWQAGQAQPLGVSLRAVSSLVGSCGFVATQVPDPTRGLQSEWLRLLATS
jgi:hypothetical protein